MTWPVVVVLLVFIGFFVDFILGFSGKRFFIWLDSKTVVKLKERKRQILWIRKRRKNLNALETNVVDSLLQKIENAIEKKNSLPHEILLKTVKDVNEEFNKKLLKHKRNGFVEFVDSIWIIVIIALMIRFFAFESFRVPTGSMIPAIYIGDMLFVNKYIYGFRAPFTTKHIMPFKDPDRGEIVVFIFPGGSTIHQSGTFAKIVNAMPLSDSTKEKMLTPDFVKRTIGLPGDKILLNGDKIFVNGSELKRKKINDNFVYVSSDGVRRVAEVFEETNIDGESYNVLYHKGIGRSSGGCPYCGKEFTVPDGKLFVMGDNRDNSHDSRYWGFVPMENLKGRASIIWFSVSEGEGFHLERIGQWIE